jgi:hypothetical protein
MSDYQLQDKTFTIKNYNQKRPFASFLPGISGPLGMPLWAFYVNRAQGISGFGVRDKNQPMMPFTPANKAYESVAASGFRTFIKHNGDVYEPFAVTTPFPHQMSVNQASFSIEETNTTLGLTTKVLYYGLPQESLSGLVRTTTFTNTSTAALTLEILDGIAEFLPAGIQNDVFKSLSNIMASWISVERLDHQLGFFKLRSSTSDSSEVKTMNEGHFYLAVHQGKRITPIVDPGLVFDYDTSKQVPVYFKNHDVSHIQAQPQVTTNMIPTSFIPLTITLQPGESTSVYAIAGYVREFSQLQRHLDSLSSEAYWQSKEQEAADVITVLTKEINTSSARPLFDAYVEQAYLDNILRGGYPVQLGQNTYHLYSRRHGDLERDYNFFTIAPEFYSQGNGNFRDVCQNRRLDVAFHPEVKRANIYQFLNLIQLDGYNPLSINGATFLMKNLDPVGPLLSKYKVDISALLDLLHKPFTPVQVMYELQSFPFTPGEELMEVFEVIMSNATLQANAQFGEGYWTDHFTYVLDLIDNYMGIYPDDVIDFLYQDTSYRYFESPVTVRPLHEKITISSEGNVRQYHGLRHPDEEKIQHLHLNQHGTNWAIHQGTVYQTNLYAKLLTLVLTKHSLLDRFDYGIEMEADKPGWNDAMNGLPGLVGSGISETIELLRIIEFMIQHHSSTTFEWASETHTLFQQLQSLPGYEARLQARESYRDAIRFGPQEGISRNSTDEVQPYLRSLQEYLQQRLDELINAHEGIIPTFLYADIDTFTIDEHTKRVETVGVSLHVLPTFLEAPARLLKTKTDQTTLQTMHQKIRQSELFDPTLQMYKTSTSLESSTHEIGRIKAFTPGWLERESNFLHMTYKYLLGLLQAGLYDEYYESLETNLVCFMDPAVYGRSPLENSSFIAPTNNPDPKIHGQGFFARLSGSTVEALHMWYIMMTGGTPFRMNQGELEFSLQPKLHHSFFTNNGEVQFRLFHRIDVTIRNKNKASTYDQCDIKRIELGHQGERIIVEGPTVRGHQATLIRSGYYDTMIIEINE